MASSTLRKAIGSVKDQTSIGIAKVASNVAPDLEVAIVKATSHDDDAPSDKYIREILSFSANSRGFVQASVALISRRLRKTRDWIVAVKALILVHRLISDGNPLFHHELLHYSRRGTRLLNLSDFRDEAHSGSWDHSAFVRTFATYLDQRLEMLIFDRKPSSTSIDHHSPPPRAYEYSDEAGYNAGPRRTRSYGDVAEAPESVTPLREMTPERVFTKMSHLQRVLDRFLACRPTGMAKSSRLILVAVYPIVKESFQLYADICEVLAVLLDKFFDMEYTDCVKAFDAYASAAKQIDELVNFYNWCKETGVARSSEYPQVQRITGKLLETLDEFVKDRSKKVKGEIRVEREKPTEEEVTPDMNEIKALPAPESFVPEVIVEEPKLEPKLEVVEDLVNLRDENVTADDQGNKLALALFNGSTPENGSWEAFGQSEVTSAWQNPAAEAGKADWELALVETASNLTKQRADLGGGFDSLLLNGMYDQGMVRQYTSTSEMGGGSASSVALPAKSPPVLALPAPDGSVQAVSGDPFAASLSFPPPSYVQMSDMEKKQHLLAQEQMMWKQYSNDGMRGNLGTNGAGYHSGAPQYGMPHMQGIGPSAGYYYPPF